MTVLSVVKGADPEVLKVGLSDGSSFFIRLSYLPPEAAAPEAGDELDEEACALLAAGAERYEAERAALRLAAAQEHSRAGLSIKLARRGFSDSARRFALDRLCGLGFVDDERYAELWLRSRVRSRAEGPSALGALLRKRGVDRDTAKTALAAVLDEETLRALILRCAGSLRKKGATVDALPRALRALGFSSDAVREALAEE